MQVHKCVYHVHAIECILHLQFWHPRTLHGALGRDMSTEQLCWAQNLTCNSKQLMLESCCRAERDIFLFLLFLLLCVSAGVLYCVCIAQVMAGKGKTEKWAITVKVTSMPWGWRQDPCVHSWLGSWCVCCVAPGCLGSIPLLCTPERGQFPRWI